MRTWLAAIILGAALAPTAFAQGHSVTIEVQGSKQAAADVALCIPLNVPIALKRFNEIAVLVDLQANAAPLPVVGQLTMPSLTTESLLPAKDGMVRRDLHVVVPKLPANQTITLIAKFENVNPQVDRFAWSDQRGLFRELAHSGSGVDTPILRYMKRPFDDSSKEARDKSYKVFHHLFDPAGKRLVTNGGQADDDAGDPRKLLFPHHRGIMYAFNRCSYGPDLKKKADTWHCTGDAHVSHERHLGAEAGPLLGRHRVELNWHGEKKEVFAIEQRELTVYNLPGGTLVEFASRLKTAGGKVRLDGDPQHAGFQFRAHNDVAVKTAKQTYYLRPDGKGALDETRNWDPKTKKGPVDLPWDTLSFVLGDQRYSVCYLNPPGNPKETRFSERNYGRFGGYFEFDLTEKNPLVVNYRLWLQDGEMTGEQAAALWAAFANPPATKVK